MSDNKSSVPYVVFEGEMTRQERIHKRDFIEKIILIFLLVLTNLGWIYYESQWTYTETVQEVEQEAQDGTNYFVGGNMNGTPNSQNHDKNQNP